MFSSLFPNPHNNIVVTIGSKSTIITRHNNHAVVDKILLNETNIVDAAKQALSDFFKKNSNHSVYILLDTTDQTYKRKLYPNVSVSKLTMKHDLQFDGDEHVLKSFKITKRPKFNIGNLTGNIGNEKIECLFTIAETSDAINNWVAFLSEMPNRLIGLYLLPLETCSLYNVFQNIEKKNIAKLIAERRKKAKNLKKGLAVEEVAQTNVKNPINLVNQRYIYHVTIQTRAVGYRQVIFSDSSIIFTRIVNIDFNSANFAKTYEQDIYSAMEYIKRTIPDASTERLKIINILPDTLTKRFAEIGNTGLSIENYNVDSFAKKIGITSSSVLDEDFSDLMLAHFFSQREKFLKLTTPKISFHETLFTALQSTYYINIFLILSIIFTLFFSAYRSYSGFKQLESEEEIKYNLSKDLAQFRKTMNASESESLANETEDLNNIIELGKVEEAIGSVGTSFTDFYSDLKFLKSSQIKFDGFGYAVNGFDAKTPSRNVEAYFTFYGKVINPSGDIEDFFKEFDNINNDITANVKTYDIKHSDLPRNLDFTKKYYDFPIDYKFTKKR